MMTVKALLHSLLQFFQSSYEVRCTREINKASTLSDFDFENAPLKDALY